jgi:malonyl-CoA/methylmalonyl-CoA synthetase
MLYLGTVRAGGVFLPLNTAYTPAEVAYFLGDAEPKVFVCDPARAEGLRPAAERAGARLETLGHMDLARNLGRQLADRGLAAATAFNTRDRGPDDLAAILYTSGTTGRSKGAMLSHENLASNARTLVETWRFTREDVLITPADLSHPRPVHGDEHDPDRRGRDALLPRFDPERVLSSLRLRRPP